jgi:hypothetical protein
VKQGIVFYAMTAALLMLGTARAAAPTDGLVLHYSFSGNANDATHLMNNGVSFGATLAADRFGVENSAYHFNGTGAYMQAAGPLPEMASATVSLWLSLDSWLQYQNWGAPQVVFFEGDDGPGRDFGCYLIGGVHFFVKANEGLSYFNWMPPVGVWTHLVCVADAENQKMSIWINGRKVKEGPFSGGANIGYHAQFNLGRRPAGITIGLWRGLWMKSGCMTAR